VEHFNRKTTIPAIVSHHCMDISSLTWHSTEPEKHPPFSLVPAKLEGIPIKYTWGRHQLEAVECYNNVIAAEFMQLQEEHHNITLFVGGDFTPQDHRQFNKELVDDEEFSEIEKYRGQWVIAVYNEGMTPHPGSILQYLL
jgi:hypothetical protein